MAERGRGLKTPSFLILERRGSADFVMFCICFWELGMFWACFGHVPRASALTSNEIVGYVFGNSFAMFWTILVCVGAIIFLLWRSALATLRLYDTFACCEDPMESVRTLPAIIVTVTVNTKMWISRWRALRGTSSITSASMHRWEGKNVTKGYNFQNQVVSLSPLGARALLKLSPALVFYVFGYLYEVHGSRESSFTAKLCVSWF